MSASAVVMAPFLWERLWRRPGNVIAALPVLAFSTREGSREAKWLDDAVAAAARRLAAGLAYGSPDEARIAARTLAGLGPGSTPAGDDVLVGACHALWAMTTARTATARKLASEARRRTTSQSAAWLQQAADGRASAPWHSLLAAIAAGSSERLRAAVTGVAAAGASSGTWSLQGFRLATMACRRIAVPTPARQDPSGSSESPPLGRVSGGWGSWQLAAGGLDEGESS